MFYTVKGGSYLIERPGKWFDFAAARFAQAMNSARPSSELRTVPRTRWIRGYDWAVTAETIALVLLDIDGVISEGEAQPLDLDLMGELAALNRAARANEGGPAVTLCTGRPAPYLEVFLQAIDGHLPGIYENGAGMYLPATYRFVTLPGLQDRLHAFEQVRQRLHEQLVRPGRAFFQPGKDHSLTLFAIDPVRTEDLEPLAAEALGDLAAGVELVYSTSCLNVLPRGVDKGQGVAFLAKTLGIAEAAILGVGDSDVDLPFLSRVGHSAAPANANPRVRQLVDYVASRPSMEGVREILRYYQLQS